MIKDKIAVLIPCYNEEQTIAKVVSDYKQALPEATIYVYDNNSTDNTVKIAQQAGAIVRHEYRQGKGNVIRSMFRQVHAECYLMIDGDDTYPAEDARKLVDAVLNEGADMVVGDRLSSTYFTENKRPFHNFGNVLVRRLINTIFKSNVQDIMTGYRAFSYEFVKTFPVLSKGFEIETEMSIFAVDRNFYIKEIPVNYRDRPEGSESKLNTFSDGFKVLKTIVSLFKYYRPALFFSSISLLFLILASVTFFPIFFEFTRTGFVEKLPTLVISGVFMVLTLLSFSVGIILDTQSKSERQSFEILLNQVVQSKER
ncbi:glycosyltransferase [Carnobacteriaceae bacterium zg-ZUI252]|nr:glycosyltransferase [Carnobacteriaceae bacterium zg-ZUI252]MBS4769700.1 glycosyltransferase [Carnobacteriaceae bacterium zg-ZUI240]QTU83113.1 glycosyltransferase [Carnobacteriaceae bacterium zg-C25]